MASDNTHYSLVIGEPAHEHGRITSSNAQLLRDFGAYFARGSTQDSDLTLLGPNGDTVARFDIWTDGWRSAG